jgi:predicted CopG family antitoxin
MSTTIQVKDDVLDMLTRLKVEINAKSYDEVIRYLFVKARRMDKSHFGSLPKLETFEREEIDRLG